MSGESKSTIKILNNDIPVLETEMKQQELSFFPENPRIYSLVYIHEDEPSQAEIERRLRPLEHVKQLVQSIKNHGGLIDPLIVRDGENKVVLEGNSRLAAYRILAEKDPITWGTVKVKLLPSDISENLVFSLLGNYHITGKKDWAPFEQAGYLYRRKVKHGIDVETIANEVALPTKKVRQLITVYSFMTEHNEAIPGKWSYYEEYLKSQPIKKAREEHPDLDDVIVQKIKDGNIEKAVDIRDKVSVVCKAGGKILKKFIEEKQTLSESFSTAVSKGVNNDWIKRIKKFREQILDPDCRKELRELSEQQKKTCIFELNKVKGGIDKALKVLDD